MNEGQNSGAYFDILMNPINYEIKHNDEAILITRNSESANNICNKGATGSTLDEYHSLNKFPKFRFTEDELS